MTPEMIKLKVLAVCALGSREDFFLTLSDRDESLEAELCRSAQELESVKKRKPDADLVALAADRDTPEVRALITDAVKLAGAERIPTLAVIGKDAPELIGLLYDHNITECVPDTITGEHLTRRIRQVIERNIANRQMRVLVERKEKELEQQRESLHYRDDLTGCLNLAGFRLRVQELLKEHPDWTYTLWYCDIKNFKYINEQLGYHAGDELLKYWGQLALNYKREGEVIGSIAGDRFVGLIRITENNESSPMEGVLDQVRNYFNDRGYGYSVQIVTGIYTLTPEDYRHPNVDHMIANAKIAQQQLKSSASRERWAVYNPEHFEKERRRMMISMHLSAAIEKGEILVYFQPQYNYRTNNLRGAEALCRWNHPELGWISPAEFIPVLESTGQITELDMFVWEKVCAYLRDWNAQGIRVPVSVNISRMDVLAGNLTEIFLGLLKKYGLDPSVLHLEITESSYLDNAELLIREVTNLTNAGFSVEMDDFGSGYSSLNMLKEVPVNVLKMDLRFLTRDGDAFRGGNIVNHVVRMAHAMNMEVVAEGVETSLQADFLKSCGCYSMQGFLFSKPIPFEEFDRVVRKEKVQERFITDDETARKYIGYLIDTQDAGAVIFNRFISAAGIFSYDGKNLDLVLANDALFEDLHDTRMNFPVGNELFTRLTPESSLILRDILDNTIQYGVASGILQTGDTHQFLRVKFHYLYLAGKDHLLFCEQQNVTRERSEYDLRERSYAELNRSLSLIPGAVFRYARGGEREFDYISPSMLSILGYRREEDFRRKFNNSFKAMIWREDRERALQQIEAQIALGDTEYCEYRVEKADGSLMWVFDRGHLVTEKDGTQRFYVVIANMDEEKAFEQSLRLQQDKLRALSGMPGVIIFDYSAGDDTLELSLGREELPPEVKTVPDVLKAEAPDVALDAESLERMRSAAAELLVAGGSGSIDVKGSPMGLEYGMFRCFYTCLKDEQGRVSHILGRMHSIESDLRLTRELRDRAEHDSMTDLLNHDAVLEGIHIHLKNRDGGTLMMFDIDDFKNVNDRNGHIYGDTVLKMVAKELWGAFRRTDLIGRFGGDEFLVFLPRIFDGQFALQKAQEIKAACESFDVENIERLTLSCGIAVVEPGTAIGAHDLVRRADQALYEVKRSGKNSARLYKE